MAVTGPISDRGTWCIPRGARGLARDTLILEASGD